MRKKYLVPTMKPHMLRMTSIIAVSGSDDPEYKSTDYKVNSYSDSDYSEY